MSVKFHEAVCLNSRQHRLDWLDHFWGDSVQALWNQTVGGGGTIAVVDSVAGGIVRLSTPTASDEAILNWGNIRSLHMNKFVNVEMRIRANGGVTDTNRRLCQLWFDSNNRIGIYHSYDSTTVRIFTYNGGASTFMNANFNIDDDWHIYRIKAFPTAVHFYIDGVETLNSPITTNLPNDAADFLQPHTSILSNADSDPSTSQDIDYVYVRQER